MPGRSTPMMRGFAALRKGRAPTGVKFIEHTADAGIEVQARSLEECFARAAAGMFACFADPRRKPESPELLEVEAKADGLGELLVAWLEELLYISEVKGLVLLRFWVDRIEAGRLWGRAEGFPIANAADVVGPAAKAVTRHRLEVQPSGSGWRARVLFDV